MGKRLGLNTSDTSCTYLMISVAIQALRNPRIRGFAVHVRQLNGGDGRAVGKFVSYDNEHVQGYSVHGYNEGDIVSTILFYILNSVALSQSQRSLTILHFLVNIVGELVTSDL